MDKRANQKLCKKRTQDGTTKTTFVPTPKWALAVRPDLVKGTTQLEVSLEYWREQGFAHPTLEKLARKWFGAPATSTPSERVFSTSGNAVTNKRSSLKKSKVNDVVFLHDNTEAINEILKNRSNDNIPLDLT